MFASTLTLLALATLPFISAAPAPAAPTSGYVSATLIGAADAKYVMQIPTTGIFTPTGNALSISHIQTDGGPCGFFGIDGLLYTTEGAGYGDVGPPQTIVGVACGARSY